MDGPGVVLLWSGDEPRFRTYRIPPAGLVLGRELFEVDGIDDRISRQHARVEIRDAKLLVRDFGSRNGTYAGGHALVDKEVLVTPPSVVRTGRSVCVLVGDVGRHDGVIEEHDGIVIGPRTRALHDRARELAVAGTHVLVVGERGSGRTTLARTFARARPGEAVFYDPKVATASLMNTVRPSTKTLVISNIEHVPAPQLVALVSMLERLALICTSTARGSDNLLPKLRDRLVAIDNPPLRDRYQELVALVARAVREATPTLKAHATLPEACLLRPWPGNIPELVTEVTRAAQVVAAQGKVNVRGEDLDHDSGHLVVGAVCVFPGYRRPNRERP